MSVARCIMLGSLVAVICLAGAAALEGWRCPDGESGCTVTGEEADEQHFRVNGSRVLCGLGEQYAWVKCNGLGLDHPALPVLASARTVRRVRLSQCELPVNASVAEALRDRNLSVVDSLAVLLPAGAAPLTRLHLRGLPPGLSLDLTAAAPLRPAEDFLADTQVADLRLTGLTITSRMLEHLPASLISLSVDRTNVSEIPAAVLNRLGNLTSLIVREEGELALDLSGSSVRAVHLRARVEGVPLGPRVENASVAGGRGLRLRGGCGALRRLRLRGVRGARDPLHVARCAALQELQLWDAAVALPPAPLPLPQLRVLTLSNCSLTKLPPDLLRDTVELEDLDLSYNQLGELPELPGSLRSLSAARCGLGAAAARRAGGAARLRRLQLSDNPLRDACGGAADHRLAANAVSVYSRLPLLSSLSLRGTGATRLCADWRRAPNLLHIDLSYNNITELNYWDLQWSRSSPTEVDLRHNPIAAIYYTEEDYKEAIAYNGTGQQLSRLRLPRRARCDCGWYWWAAAARTAPAHCANTTPVMCDQSSPREVINKSIDAVPPSLLSCPAVNVSCPRGCECVVAGGLRVRCGPPAGGRGGAGTMPALGALRDRVVELRVNGWGVQQVTLDQLPPALEILDISNNSISSLSAEVMSALRAAALSLADNPLACDCAHRDFLLELMANTSHVVDYERVRCADGRAPAAAAAGGACGARGTVAYAAGGAALLVLAAAAGAAAARRWLPARLRSKLARLAQVAEVRGEFAYDVFVSHAHRDWPAGKLVAEAAEAAGLAACVHWRDWPPGAPIAAQIARSVGAARRTAVLLSAAYLRSTWARAELAAALADPRRVLLVLLEPPPADLPPELALVLRSHTYLDARDPDFAAKLVAALRPPRRRAPAAPRPPVGAPLDDGTRSSDGDVSPTRSCDSETALVA